MKLSTNYESWKKIEIKTQTKKSEIRVWVGMGWDGSLRKMSRQWALLLLER